MKLYASTALLLEAEEALKAVAERHGLSVASEWDQQDFWKVRFWGPPDRFHAVVETESESAPRGEE